MADDLKEVSKAKHRILEKYFPVWMAILGSRNQHLAYVDCFAGEGKYEEDEPGSPIITFRLANRISNKSNIAITLVYVERNSSTAEKLRTNLALESHFAPKVDYHVISEDAKEFTKELLYKIPSSLPAFFFVDPYGHPISIPVINQILSRPRSEVLLNLMWFSLNRHLSNPKETEAIDKLFGDDRWKKQPFMLARQNREKSFLEYFCLQIKAQFYKEFRVRFSPEDNVKSGGSRTKYYLIHFSNHPKAVLLMKQVMWDLGDEEGTFD